MDMNLGANILSWQWIITAVSIALILFLLFSITTYKTKLGEKLNPRYYQLIGSAIGFTAIILSSLIN